MSSKTSEELAARWLGGRGTVVLYFAIILAIFGVLATAQTMAQARAEQEVTSQLVVEVKSQCSRVEFRAANSRICTHAAEVDGSKSSPAPPDEEYAYVLNTNPYNP